MLASLRRGGEDGQERVPVRSSDDANRLLLLSIILSELPVHCSTQSDWIIAALGQYGYIRLHTIDITKPRCSIALHN